MKKMTNIVITLAFAFACFSLWAMLTSLNNLSAHSNLRLPGFSAFVIGFRPWLLMIPVPVVGYCLYSLFRRQQTDQSGTTFLAYAMSGLCVVFFPVLMAVFLPCLALLQQAK